MSRNPESVITVVGAVSEPYALVMNLYREAWHHIETCPGQSCGISLWQLKTAAISIGAAIHDANEQRSYRAMLQNWPD